MNSRKRNSNNQRGRNYKCKRKNSKCNGRKSKCNCKNRDKDKECFLKNKLEKKSRNKGDNYNA